VADKETNRVLTVRNVPAEVDTAIVLQARALGRSKSELVQELLSATFGDPIDNFIRTSELVALMDREMEKVTGLPLSASAILSAFFTGFGCLFFIYREISRTTTIFGHNILLSD